MKCTPPILAWRQAREVAVGQVAAIKSLAQRVVKQGGAVAAVAVVVAQTEKPTHILGRFGFVDAAHLFHFAEVVIIHHTVGHVAAVYNGVEPCYTLQIPQRFGHVGAVVQVGQCRKGQHDTVFVKHTITPR